MAKDRLSYIGYWIALWDRVVGAGFYFVLIHCCCEARTWLMSRWIFVRSQWRSLDGLIAFTRSYQPPDATGTSRLELLRLGFGQWFGPELSVTSAVRQGVPLMFVLDSADNPDLNRFAAALVWQAANRGAALERPGRARG